MNEETPEKLAAIIAEEDATPDMVPVITKEIYHYYILSAMRENGFLERLHSKAAHRYAYARLPHATAKTSTSPKETMS